MPAGLDGNSDPVVSPAREIVLAAAVQQVLNAASASARTLVAIDGRSGSGKSTFADELAARVGGSGLRTLRSTTDSFHRPRADRLRRGSSAADGYYLDSYQLNVVVDELLGPFTRGESRVLLATFDEPTDCELRETAAVDECAVLIFDGLFLQRPELEAFWDLVIYLEADARLDERWLSYLLVDLPADPSARAAMIDDRLDHARWPRYRAGWGLYVDAVDPAHKAMLVIDNNDIANPRVVGP